MLFNSIYFAVFLTLVFTIYWFFTKQLIQWQNATLLIASYFFYAYWDWRFLFLLLFSTALDYFSALKIARCIKENSKKNWLRLSLIINLGILGLFKYYDFFALSFSNSLLKLGCTVPVYTLKLILPIGISFYTFHGLSYIIDVYKKRINAEKNFVNYAVFVSFFPLLVAGPIERATHLLPQVKSKRKFDYLKAVDGLKQILWGLFKKIVIADHCAVSANQIFDNYTQYSGSTLFLGAVFFAFQIYGDFSGYSDIAIGVGRLFGFDLLQNFSFPFFSRNMAEFWRRWHISLSSWFRDYLYLPLGGNKGTIWVKLRNIFIVFLISGFWHGANWTFICWGFLNAVFSAPFIVLNKNKIYREIVAKGKKTPTLKELIAMTCTFTLATLVWIFFRSNTIDQAFKYISIVFSKSFFTKPQELPLTLVLIFVFIIIEWIGRENQYAISKVFMNKSRVIRWSFYLLIGFVIMIFQGTQQKFIYFQF